MLCSRAGSLSTLMSWIIILHSTFKSCYTSRECQHHGIQHTLLQTCESFLPTVLTHH